MLATTGDPPAEQFAEKARPREVERVLVVDDNKPAAELLAALIRREGFDVRTAFDGADSLRIAAEFQPQAVYGLTENYRDQILLPTSLR